MINYFRFPLNSLLDFIPHLLFLICYTIRISFGVLNFFGELKCLAYLYLLHFDGRSAFEYGFLSQER